MVLPPISAVWFDMAIAIRRCCKIYKDVAGKGSDLKAGGLHARGAGKIYKDVAGKGSDLKAGGLHARGAVVGW
ncbi:hypothetical protein B296_00014718 [Ensete ventricosum]|uniref:Uncharacterized protein n=1 Tax=Ensete ventricosum TaxID=4639 RepID=A0A426YF99_ENSVE|nr:hypothetical protein B296_00014718 [Ensete ventricosum]